MPTTALIPRITTAKADAIPTYDAASLRASLIDAVREIAAQWKPDLARSISAIHTATWQVAIQDQMDTLYGQDAPEVPELADADLLAGIEAHAEATSSSIADTMATDFAQWAEANVPEGMTADEGAGLIDTWLADREDWKEEQIARTETGYAYHTASATWADANGLQSTWRVLPDTAQCRECQDMINHNPYEHEDGLGLPLPLHPNCSHYIVLDVPDPATVPDDPGDMWMGDEGQ